MRASVPWGGVLAWDVLVFVCFGALLLAWMPWCLCIGLPFVNQQEGRFAQEILDFSTVHRQRRSP